jgi:hypothetical protein
MRPLVRAKFVEWPPSMAYEARVNGAPAKPIRGTVRVPRSSRIAWSTIPSSSRGSKRRKAKMSARVRTGFSMAGPSPATKSNGIPSGAKGMSRSLKRMAASTSRARMG